MISATTSGQTAQYGYDAQNRQTSVSLPDDTNITNTYDYDGRRVKQVVGTQTTNYLWDEASLYGDVVLETGSGNTTSYVLAGSELLSQTRNGFTSYYLQDGQGSTRTLTNNAGNVTDTYSYSAFGELQNQTGSTVNPYLYTGQQFDDSTGLYSLRARYYAPGMGRFLSQDTFGVNFNNPIELNRYVYTANNPINYSDPSGNQALLEYLQANINSVRNAVATYRVGGAVVYGYLLALNTPWIVNGLLIFGAGVEGYLAYRALFLGDQDAAFALATGYQLTNYGYSALADLSSRVSGRIFSGAIARAIWGHPNANQAEVNFDDFISRVFKGNYNAYNEFITRLQNGLPAGTKIFARGSSVTGYKWTTGRSFDALGPGTSDLDLLLVGDDALKVWNPSDFKIPGMYTINLGNETPSVAPTLNPLRVGLQNSIYRPLNIQAASQFYLDTRLLIQGAKYLLLK